MESSNLLTWSTDDKVALYGSGGVTDSSQDTAPTNNRKPRVLLRVCSFILITEFCERLAYYGILSLLPVLFATKFGISLVLTTELNSVFSMLSYLSPLLGAYVADMWLGRFRTIWVFCIVYVIGLALCVISLWPASPIQPLFFVAIMLFVTLGSGGIKPNVVVFGADQFKPVPGISNDILDKQKSSFFRWYYWAINLGSLFAHIVLANLAINGSGHVIPSERGFFACFVIIFVAFVIGTIVFLCGSPRYRKQRPTGSKLARCFRLCLDAGKASRQGNLVLASLSMFLPAVVFTLVGYFTSKRLQTLMSGLGMSFVLGGVVCLILFSRSSRWLIVARRSLGGKYLEAEVSDMDSIVRLLPYYGFMILFWAIYGQMQTNFVIQGCQMDVRIDNQQLNATSLSAFNSASILVLIPVFEKIIFPLLNRRGYFPSSLHKIAVGFGFSVLAMIAAAGLEASRKTSGLVPYNTLTMPRQDVELQYTGSKYTTCESNCCNPNMISGNQTIECSQLMRDYGCHCHAVDGMSLLTGCSGEPITQLSIWFQGFQFVLIGISEILANTSSYEFFYNQVPQSMRSISQALNLLTTCLGMMVAGGLNSMFSSWISSDLNHGHLERIFTILAVLMFINFVLFLMVSRTFRYTTPDTARRFPATSQSTIDDDQFQGTDPQAEAVAIPTTQPRVKI